MLTWLFKRIENSYIDLYKPIHMNLNCDLKRDQLQLPLGPTENMYSSYHGHVKMGQFYEIMTQALFGGDLCDSVIDYEGNGFKGRIKPDIINSKKRLAFESKANRSGHHMNLLDFQMNNYEIFQIVNYNYQIYFCFYRHGYQRINHVHISPNQLNEALSKKTYALIALPFDIIRTMWKTANVFKRYETKTWHHCTQINSPYMNLFLSDPDLALQTIGFDPNDFFLKKYITPPEFKIQGCSIDPFLVVIVKSLNYFHWVKENLLNKVPF